MLVFIVLTLAFGIDEKIGTPTSVIVMAINSVVGAFIYTFVLQNVDQVQEYWLVTMQIVIFGAPFGVYVVSKINRAYLILSILFLITVELGTTIWLISFTPTMYFVAVMAIILNIFLFWAMLYYR